ncbi:hypothetical protein [Streptomyces colonosanans]|uniref:hypothetical protein n=1 Tax=Streptomyces colonosanans TaxID=1428652 RepID=UPI00115FAEA7|nr:hypothetical protein [Streptomyces colonosanans]
MSDGQRGPLDPVDGVRHLCLVDGAALLEVAVDQVGVMRDLVTPLGDLQIAAAEFLLVERGTPLEELLVDAPRSLIPDLFLDLCENDSRDAGGSVEPGDDASDQGG